MGLDINFNKITYTVVDVDSSGNLALIWHILFNGLKRALMYKIVDKKLWKRYSRS